MFIKYPISFLFMGQHLFLDFADILQESPRFDERQHSVAGDFILRSLNDLLVRNPHSSQQLIIPESQRFDRWGKWEHVLGVISTILNEKSPGAGQHGCEVMQSDIDCALAWGSHYLRNDSLVVSGQSRQTGMYSDWMFCASMLVPSSIDEQIIYGIIHHTVERFKSQEKYSDFAFVDAIYSAPQQLSYWGVSPEDYQFTHVSFSLRSRSNLERSAFYWIFTGLCRDNSITLPVINASIDRYDTGWNKYPWTAHLDKPKSLHGLSGVYDDVYGYWKSVFFNPEWRSLGTVIHELYHVKLNHIISDDTPDSLRFGTYEPHAVAGALRAFVDFDKKGVRHDFRTH